jgi:hypothetical protein
MPSPLLIPVPQSATTPKRTVAQITVAGGNLYQIAAQYLGDATQWNRIARMQNPIMWDPFIVGTVNLWIPPVDANAGNGGILGV